MSSSASPKSVRAGGLYVEALAPSAHFWSDLGALLIERDDLADSIVIVATDLDGHALRAALGRAAVNRGMGGLRLPRITTLRELALERVAVRAASRSDSARRVELFEALKSVAWLQEHARSGSQALWSMARLLTELCDQLTLGLGSVPARDAPIEARVLAAAKGSYRNRAWEACSAEAQLVLDVWRATLSHDDGAARILRGLDALLSESSGALIVVRARAWEPFERTFYERYAERRRVDCVERDLGAALAAHPALAAAWPELAEDTAPGESVIALRALALRASGKRLSHVALAPCNSLEEQATRAAAQIVSWRDMGVERIGVIALDRVVARRMRALLERAGVLVRDEAGWRFSTTAVAGTLMRWLEMAQRDEGQCDSEVLLDWLKSPHSCSGIANKPELLAAIELAIRRHGVMRGLTAVAGALTRELRHARREPGRALGRAIGLDLIGDAAWPLDVEGRGAAPPARRATLAAALELIESLKVALSWRAQRASLAQHFAWLERTMQATGMAQALALDVGGAQLLAQLRVLSSDALRAPGAARLSFDEWRDYLGDALENATFRDDSIKSPIAITDFSASALREFDAVLVLGADAEHFPLRDQATLFLNGSLQVQLGLSDPDQRLLAQRRELALLLASAQRVLITWQSTVQGEKRAPASALARLSLVHQAAFGDDLKRPWVWPTRSGARAPILLPRPQAPTLVPVTVTASQYATLVHCPYQYFVRTLLGLRALDDLSDEATQRDYGEIVHRILERFHADRLEGTPDTMVEALAALGEMVFEEVVGDNPAYLGYRQRWRSVCASYVEWLVGMRDSGWRLSGAEAEATRELQAGGRTLRLNGRLDRLERRADELLIIDYKAKDPKRLKDDLRVPGEDVQLPFYRLLQGEHAHVRATYLSVDRKQVKAVAPVQPIDQLSAALEERLVSDFGRIAEGAPLPALGAEQTCQYCEARGLCRRGQWSDQTPRVNPAGD
jgi:ATP-dependent helicase/nuclease subunit B